MHLSQFSKMYYKNIDWRRDKSCPYLVRFISTSICCGALRVHRVNLKKKVLTVCSLASWLNNDFLLAAPIAGVVAESRYHVSFVCPAAPAPPTP